MTINYSIARAYFGVRTCERRFQIRSRNIWRVHWLRKQRLGCHAKARLHRAYRRAERRALQQTWQAELSV